MNRENSKEILQRYEEGTATPEEIKLVEAWYQSYAEGGAMEDLPTDAPLLLHRDWEQIQVALRPRFNWKPIAVAASLLLAGFIGFVYYKSNQATDVVVESIAAVEDREPGGNRASLVLEDGSIIQLNDANEGIIATAESLIYDDGTEVSPEASPIAHTTLSLITPNGGQYQITLPDGTRVWLNSATTLEYPSSFSGSERRVELSGEAYFEVAPNPKQPFYVLSEGQEVKVLGTHFNIKAYSDEKEIRTTLLEGLVSVKKDENLALAKVLKAGQQSVLKASSPQILIQQVDVESGIAWKNGFFSFQKTPLSHVLSEVARWYDIEVAYDKLPKATVTAYINRNTNLSNIIYGLEQVSGLKLQLKEGRLISEH